MKTNSRALILAALLAGAGGGVAIIKPWESKGGEPDLIGYLDPVGIPTDCWGNTAGARVGALRTLAECQQLLDSAITTTARRLSECVNRELSRNQAAAVLSWAYNVGAGAACRSTLVGLINSGQPASVWCQQLLRWTYAGGQHWPGLMNRRRVELQVCTSPD